jgi:hypothetical protein
MSWIKRNLFFVVFSATALVLVGLAGFYAWSKYTANTTAWDNLSNDYEELKRLNSAPILPGDGKINNVELANSQRTQLLTFIKATRPYFEHIQPIPNMPTVSDQDFSTALGMTLNRLQRDATNNSVVLTVPNYSFSFQAEQNKVSFTAGGLAPLSVQLGDIKAICEVLFNAKVNSLDNIRRERASPDDSGGPQSDFLVDKSVTNDLAIITPYEVTFKSFTTELAAVLSGFASSPYGMVVKSINVKSAPSAPAEQTPAPGMQYAQPPPRYYPQGGRTEVDAQAAFNSRYGIGGGGGGDGGRYGGGGGANGGIAYRPLQTGQGYAPAYPQPTYAPQQPYASGAAAVNKGGLTTLLDEKQLEITIDLALIKLLPPKNAR